MLDVLSLYYYTVKQCDWLSCSGVISVYKRWEMQKPSVSTRLSYLSAFSGPRRTSLQRSSSGTSMIRRSTWTRSLTSRCSEWVHTHTHQNKLHTHFGVYNKTVCFLFTERKKLWQYTQGTCCVWEDEIGECIISCRWPERVKGQTSIREHIWQQISNASMATNEHLI